MKKIVFVFGLTQCFENQDVVNHLQILLNEVRGMFPEIECVEVDVSGSAPVKAIRDVLRAIGEHEGTRKNTLVLYEGSNLEVLGRNSLCLCTCIDINLLKNKLKEVIGYDGTPEKDRILDLSFHGAIYKLIAED